MLFAHDGAFDHRRHNRVLLGLAILAAAPLPFGILRWAEHKTVPDASLIALFGLLATVSAVLADTALKRSRRLVTHLEAWPRSHLMLVRTAGIWRERLSLVSLAELNFTPPAQSDAATRPGYHTMRLAGWRRLWLELDSARTLAPPETWRRLQYAWPSPSPSTEAAARAREDDAPTPRAAPDTRSARQTPNCYSAPS